MKKGENFDLLNPVIVLTIVGFNIFPEDIEIELKNAFEIINEPELTEEELETRHKRHDYIYMQKLSIGRAARISREEGYNKRNKETALKMRNNIY